MMKLLISNNFNVMLPGPTDTDTINTKLQKRKKDVAPVGKKYIIIFVDFLNMPKSKNLEHNHH